jgi:hypothetical protein
MTRYRAVAIVTDKTGTPPKAHLSFAERHVASFAIPSEKVKTTE